MKKLLPVILIVGLIFMLLLLLTPLTVTNSAVLLVAGCIYLFALLVFLDVRKGRPSNKPRMVIIISGFLVLFVLKQELSWTGDWKTQTISYEHIHWPTRTIAFQLQDKGALGYNKRTVEHTRVLPFVAWVKTIDEQQIDTSQWRKVNRDVNEMGLKY